MFSKNEWNTLEEVIIGCANDAKIPSLDISLRTVNYADVKETSTIPQGRYPAQVVNEANEDLDILCEFLKNEGIKVSRPDSDCIPDYYNFCPRDSILLHENFVIATPMPLRARKNEYKAMKYVFDNNTNIHTLNISRPDALYNLNCVNNPEVLALTEIEPAFDAANILRDNENLYYLVSNSGNRAGADLLQNLVGENYKVWKIENVYSYMHLDSTIALLREGLMLLNPERIKSKKQLPKPLQSWDVIWASEPYDIGHYPGYCNASRWVNMNLLSINPNLVVLEENQHSLRKQLLQHKIESAMLPMRHERTLGGGFHCVSLDIKRKHS